MVIPEIDIHNFIMDDGTVNYGMLMRYWRKTILTWKNASILADVYNEIIPEGEPLTERAIQRMEKQNNVPVDRKRRWLLATILNIPPAYLGLASLPPFGLPMYDVHAAEITEGPLDYTEYHSRLLHLWSSWTKHDTVSIYKELINKIETLQDHLLYGNTTHRKRKQNMSLLCHYLTLYGNIRRDQGYSDMAIKYLGKAATLAQEQGYHELGAKALYLKGYAHFDKWGILPDRKQNKADLFEALTTFQHALTILESNKKHAINAPLKSAIVAELGLVQSYTSQSHQEQVRALKTIDQAGALIQSHNFQRDPLFLNVDDEWYHIDKAEAYVALEWGKNAVDELGNVDRSNPHTRRRYIYTDIVEADAYLTKNNLEMGIACAENALELLNGTHSYIFISRIDNIYQTIKTDKRYAYSPDVARLGGKLLKLQHSYLFQE